MSAEFQTQAVALLARLLLDHEETRPDDGQLDPGVWLARIQEQLALAAYAPDHAADDVGVRLAGVACAAIGALAQMDERPVARTSAGRLRAR